MRQDLPAGTVTFLFTDVEGSTKLLHELGAEGYAQQLAEHRRVVRDACTAWNGVEVDTQGDAFFVVFPTATGGIEAANAITEGLAPGPISLRIGLHTGTPLVTDEGYVGEDVHFAARVAASAHGGQIVFSAATRSLLDDGYQLVDLGEHRLKDIPEPVPIFQLGQERFPPLKTISNTNLPRPASSFVGRERELADVLARVAGGARLVTLTGPGGAGKTRLALEAAATLVPEYRAGVFWVGLASLRNSALVTETIAQTLGAKNGLADHIGEREILLLLDNLEHVIAAATELSSLLHSCPSLTMLVTSRELLRVDGEVEYEVPPLGPSEAVALFCERARTDPTKEIDELCRCLDNLPLAVELAAARTKALSPQQILERLSGRLDLLKGGRDADPRQQTLRATIEWSYDLLTAQEQQLLCALSVFAGGCTLDAAEEVADADLDTLQSLVEKSLVRFTEERYWMLEMIREYAAEELERSGHAARLRERCTSYFAGVAARFPDAFRGRDHRIEDLDRETGNVRGALEWCLEQRDRGRALEFVKNLGAYWIISGRTREGDRWARATLAMPAVAGDARATALAEAWASELARWSGDVERAISIKERVMPILHEFGERDLATAMATDLIHIYVGRGKLQRADELADETLAVRREMGLAKGIAHTLEAVARVRWAEGAREEALTMLEEATATWDREGAPGKAASSREALADYQRRLGRLEDARASFAAALRASAEEGDVFAQLWCLRDSGSLAADLGKPESAAKIWGATAAALDEAGMSLDEEPSDYAEKLAGVQRQLGQPAFERLWEDGARLSRDEAVKLVLSRLDAAGIRERGR